MARDASGSLAETITFSKWKGVNYVKLHQKPKQPNTQSQVAVRALTNLLSPAWQQTTAGQKATWQAQATAENISPFNAFMKSNMANWALFLYPSLAYPPTRTGTIHAIDTLTVVPHGRGALMTFTSSTVNDGWGVAWHHVPGAAGNPTKDNLIRFMPLYAPGTITWLWSPLDSGTYHFRAVMHTVFGWAAYPGGNRNVVIP